MSLIKKKRKSKAPQQHWPHVYTRRYPSGQVAYVIDLGLVDGKRERQAFKTKDEAETFAEQARIKRQNEGLAAFSLPAAVRVEALKASELLQPFGVALAQAAAEYSRALAVLNPHGVSLAQVVQYYDNHVLKYRNAPVISKIVEQMLREAQTNNRRHRTVSDIRHRLNNFAYDFGDRRLTDLIVPEIKEWVTDDDWAPQTRINYLTKISQLFNYGIKNGWAEVNVAARIDRPDVEDGEPEIFTVERAKQLLEESINFGLRPYIAIGLFAGLRSAELLRLKGDAIKTEEKVIIVGADVAKKRSRRVVEMCDALLMALKPVLPIKGPVVDTSKFRDSMDALKKAVGLNEWPHNALRHSFGSYHLAFHGDQVKTAAQMGHRDSTVVHNHYKALVLKSEAEKYWTLPAR